MDADDVATLVEMGNNSEVVGKAAGQVAIGMLMEGRTSSASEVQSIMMNDCRSIGFDQIVINQKAADALTDSNQTR